MAVAFKSSRITYAGTETTETTITRVGGAVDPSGQAQSRKIVTTANAQWLRPFQAEIYAIWNATTGADVTLTVYGTANTGALPNNDDVWLEVEYLGSSASSLGKMVTTTKANLLSSNAAVASDVSVWNSPATTFDGSPANGAVVSGGGLTVTHTTSTNLAGIFSTSALISGKYYFEMKVVTSFTNTVSIGVGSGTISDIQGATNFTGVFLGSTCTINTNNVAGVASLGATSVGDVYGFALDLTNRLTWIRVNNGTWNNDVAANPVTGTNGLAIGAGGFAPVVKFTSGGATDAITANFGATAYANAAPAGFVSWDTGWVPFKLVKTLSSPQPGLAGSIEARVRIGKPNATYYFDPLVTLS